MHFLICISSTHTHTVYETITYPGDYDLIGYKNFALKNEVFEANFGPISNSQTKMVEPMVNWKQRQ